MRKFGAEAMQSKESTGASLRSRFDGLTTDTQGVSVRAIRVFRALLLKLGS